ncbi:MAG: YifB family Mg chelatase-like AAA ATPase [Proteobacteria bacterium]|nr:YifB family Mg chelatase-like AAA ATPase [Pseudomonadota bacterium]
MVAHVATVALEGITATPVDVQVQLRSGLTAFQVVGLPDGAVRESRERVQAALHSLGLSLPAKRITVNLSPADLSKEGSHYDLPIAVGLLIGLGILPADAAEGALFMGELSLDGKLRRVGGVLPAAMSAVAQRLERIFVPTANAKEAAWAGEITVYGADSLVDILKHLKGEQTLTDTVAMPEKQGALAGIPDFRDVRGQEAAKRAAEIAAAGGHNLLMVGPPGSGKSMIAQRLPALLPPMSATEALEVSMIHSVGGHLPEAGLLLARPFRDPHHSASAVSLTGGGHNAQPGEMSLAHRGVLFLDELPEFPRNVLETLRQPLEAGTITISRARAHVRYPARFQLVAAMNPCPCGYLGHPHTKCTDTPRQVQAYRNRLSGPLLDRIDLHIEVPAVLATDLALPAPKEGTAEMAARVAKARAIQQKRYQGTAVTCNAELSGDLLTEYTKLDSESQELLTRAATVYNLSARAYHRALRLARTIADLSGTADIQRTHVAEALSYRPQSGLEQTA